MKPGTVLPYELSDTTTGDSTTTQSKRARPRSTGSRNTSNESNENQITNEPVNAVSLQRSSIHHSVSASNGSKTKPFAGESTSLLTSVIAQCASENADEPAVDSRYEEEAKSDRCFVCHLDGELMLCDFPNCNKAYHQALILNENMNP